MHARTHSCTHVKLGWTNLLSVLVGLEGADFLSVLVIVQQGEAIVTHEAGTLRGQLAVVDHPPDGTKQS